MVLAAILLINNLSLFILEVIGYHACHSVVMLLDGYYRLCQAILCTVRIVSRRIQFTYTSRYTYGLARVGVVGELVAFIGFLSLSVSVFLESVKHLIDVIFIIPQRESNASALFTAHGREHIHSLIDHPKFIICVGVYATASNCLLGVVLLYSLMKRAKKLSQQLKQRRSSLPEPVPKKLLSKSLLITDTLPIHHSFLQILNMLLGPLAILTCGVLLLVLSDIHHVRVIYSRLVDPIICCLLFLSYLLMISIPLRDVIHLVLQAKPNSVKSNEIETTVLASVSGVISFHDFHIWRLTPQKTLATVHVVFNAIEDIITKYQDISLIFQTHGIDHVTIQPEFSLTSNEIEQHGFPHQCSISNKTCTPLQCCDNLKPIKNNTISISTEKTHFHRRSSIGIPSTDAIDDDDDDDGEIDVTQENYPNGTAAPVLEVELPVVIIVNNET